MWLRQKGEHHTELAGRKWETLKHCPQTAGAMGGFVLLPSQLLEAAGSSSAGWKQAEHPAWRLCYLQSGPTRK